MFLPAGTYTFSWNFINKSSIVANDDHLVINGIYTNFCKYNQDINTSYVFSKTFNNDVNTLTFYLGSLDPDGAYIEFSDFQIVKGEYTTETMPPYTPYTGNTYQYKLEDVNGIVHNFRSLPDGTADTYNMETGEFVEKVWGIVFKGTENWLYENVSLVTVARFYIALSPLSIKGIYTNGFNSSHF